MNPMMRFLIWALPAAFCLHVTEEFWLPGGFIAWYHQYRPKFAGVKPSHYAWVNGVGFLLILAAAVMVSTGGGYGGLLIVCGLLSCNGIFTHLFGTIKTKKYSPGVVTGITLYLPLTALCWIAVIQSNRLDFLSLLFCAAVSPLTELFFALKPGRRHAQKEIHL